jgi:hypothetical protein
MRRRLGDGNTRRIPSVRDEGDWRAMIMEDVIGDTLVAVDRPRRTLSRKRAPKGQRRHEP